MSDKLQLVVTPRQTKEPLAKLVVEESLETKLSKTLGILVTAYLAIPEIPSFASGSKVYRTPEAKLTHYPCVAKRQPKG